MTEQSSMLKRLKKWHPEREYPSRIGKKWTKQEDKSLVDNLILGVDRDIIAKKHNRTLGAIICRINLIAYNMYNNGVSKNDIMKNIGLTENQYNKAFP